MDFKERATLETLKEMLRDHRDMSEIKAYIKSGSPNKKGLADQLLAAEKAGGIEAIRTVIKRKLEQE